MERKTCRWCKYYKNGCCTKGKEIFNVEAELDDEEFYYVEEVATFEIKEPNTFCCNNFE